MHLETLLPIDKKILIIDNAICRHIDTYGTFSRGEISQDILSQLRNFVEHIMLKFYANGQDIENSYENICKAIDFVKSRGDLKVLRRFHDYLQIVASHYTLDEENSERLMLKYYEYLLKIKKLLYEKFSLEVLSNLDKFPLNNNSTLQEYYEKIAKKIEKHTIKKVENSEKYYIQKIKPFFVDQRIYYEVTFTPAVDYASKFDRVIAFTNLEITDNYAVKFSLDYDSIEILGKTMPIIIIVGWEVAIRDCEFKNFTRIIRGTNIKTGYSEQLGISRFLTSTGFTLTELIDFPEKEFQKVKLQATQRSKEIIFFNDLERCREIIKANASGSNLLKYLLFHMRNKIIKKQLDTYPNDNLSGLYAKNSCLPFDRIPFNFSLVEHNPKLGDLFYCIDATQRQHELLARLVRNNTEIKGQLFTPIKEIVRFDNLPSLVEKYNSTLWHGHLENSKLVIKNSHIIINGYKNDTKFIINKLENLSKNGIQNYSNSVKAWLNDSNYVIDCEEKKEALIRMFESSRVALVYGSAGTGKSTFINHLAHLFADKRKLFLAQTNPAVDNLKRKITASKCTFSTITKFLINQRNTNDYDLLIIDECSTVSNRDMREILNKATFNLLILVGDSYQISSIRFGNWFSVAQAFVPKTSVFELTKPYRSKNSALLTLWEKVRKMDDTILELITRQEYSTSLDSSIFTPAEDDEIILCLNYDGLYGINNINRFLQQSNPNPAISWGIQQYKVNDPILFNESKRFEPVIYNNMKGRIVGIEILDRGKISERIQFDIELDKSLNEIDAFNQDFELLDYTNNGNSIIRFCVNKLKSTDEDDDDSSKAIVPFQVAYAVSIHKAQGLEYNSVKIVITDEIDELITHNIFYTAITRARNKLKIYWTPEVEHKVLNSIKPSDWKKDVYFLKNE
ncbi:MULTISPECIES: ATP-dependent DNA helicase [Ureibacillus]|uniref:Energy-coupling factor transporter ATP-binding protein EcfA2 n=1 Tax=Ureibacillus thermosphaericus TaxID=51173 RepID=A0A840PTH1_URETH|nr:ATP-dependent RecD-like DNA helicase [Ureibacillus thermosphaericus]MBB5148484.1 energy-coupling factor transporter ATP-binding protein EcfA2 [Ureibacillus thermosphaericus]NKZ30978.1 AAA family ATPase [Ureibacillus thermosphaericus]